MKTAKTEMQPNLTEEQVANFFNNFKFRLKIFDDVRAQTDIYLASRFSVFDFIKKNELKISEIIMNLIDPNGKHGQRAAYLNVLLKKLEKEQVAGSFKVIKKEASTGKRRRIDILVEFEHFAIGIENKPYAGEGDNQIQDYVEYLGYKYKDNWVLIYLSGYGSKPKSIDEEKRPELERKGNLVTWSYQYDLSDFLNACIKETQADKMRHFLRDFQTFIAKSFKNTENSSNDE